MREVYTGLARNCEGGAEMNYNPIYLCYCKANNLNPDGKRQNSRFIWWVQEQKREYAKRHNIYGYDWTNRQVENFHRWLKEKYEIEEVEG